MNYPNGIKKKFKKEINYGNRGQSLEDDINETNKYYLLNDVAIIHKKPISLTLRKVDYPCRKEAVVKEAYFKTPSTTDYNGVYKGKYLDFEAKETNLKSFPKSNIHKHQLDHLKNISRHGGIGFIIIKFKFCNEVYYISSDLIIDYFENNLRKSIPYSYIKDKGHLIDIKYKPRIDYLTVVDKILGGNL